MQIDDVSKESEAADECSLREDASANFQGQDSSHIRSARVCGVVAKG